MSHFERELWLAGLTGFGLAAASCGLGLVVGCVVGLFGGSAVGLVVGSVAASGLVVACVLQMGG